MTSPALPHRSGGLPEPVCQASNNAVGRASEAFTNVLTCATARLIVLQAFLQDAVRLAKSICSNTSLTELYASGHELDTEAVQQFADMLAKNHTIKVLCLGNASFGDASTAILAAGLPASSSLTQLDLENKAVGREGAAALWQALSKGAPLETLLLARNPITDAGTLPYESQISLSTTAPLAQFAVTLLCASLTVLACQASMIKSRCGCICCGRHAEYQHSADSHEIDPLGPPRLRHHGPRSRGTGRGSFPQRHSTHPATGRKQPRARGRQSSRQGFKGQHRIARIAPVSHRNCR